MVKTDNSTLQCLQSNIKNVVSIKLANSIICAIFHVLQQLYFPYQGSIADPHTKLPRNIVSRKMLSAVKLAQIVYSRKDWCRACTDETPSRPLLMFKICKV